MSNKKKRTAQCSLRSVFVGSNRANSKSTMWFYQSGLTCIPYGKNRMILKK